MVLRPPAPCMTIGNTFGAFNMPNGIQIQFPFQMKCGGALERKLLKPTVMQIDFRIKINDNLIDAISK